MPQGESNRTLIFENAFFYSSLGAMYMLIGLNPDEFTDISDDKEFFTKLICEESISCLPASVRTCKERKRPKIHNEKIRTLSR